MSLLNEKLVILYEQNCLPAELVFQSSVVLYIFQWWAVDILHIILCSFYRLMKANEAALLYPGGAKEAMHEKGQDYQLFWPEESEVDLLIHT